MKTPQTIPSSGQQPSRKRSQIARARARFVLIVATVTSLVLVLHSQSAAEQMQYATTEYATTANDAGPALVVGFVGGFVHSNDLRHSEVQITRQIQAAYGNRVRVLIYENRRSAEARRMILDWFKQQAKDTATTHEKSADPQARRVRIILFGHSWGASAVVSLARRLQRDGIPVSLTIQVDSVAKNGENDSLIPANVVEAVNFYQTHGFLHGQTKITAVDPSRTKILGNFRFTYEKEPAECRAYPWYDRLLFKGHTAIECDPHVWSQVEDMIRTRLPAIAHPEQNGITARVGN